MASVTSLDAVANVEAIVARSWSYLGDDVHRWATYWTRRYANLYSVRWDSTYAADAVADAYAAYLRWRADNRPENAAKAIKSFIRRSARHAVRTSCRSAVRKPMEHCEPDQYAAPQPVEQDNARLARLIGRLPADLGEIALRLAAADVVPTVRDLADVLGCHAGTVSRRLERLRKHPAVQDVMLARIVESAIAAV